MGYPNPPFSPPCPDSLASDAISVYSLSSIASSMSFLSRPEGTSDFISQRSRQQELERHRGGAGLFASHRHTAVPRSRSSPHGAVGGHDDEEYEGYSIISNEPLSSQCDTLPRPANHRNHRGAARGGTGRGYAVSVSSRGSVSTPTSPVKATLVPSPNSPFQKVGKVSSSDTGESDQSSTETDSTVKSQEERTPGAALDPQELAQKILEETQSHMRAVETLQRSTGSVSPGHGMSGGGPPTPTGGSAFRSSETSAFSRPSSRASIKAQSSPLPMRPKPPSRTSSLQKISSGYNSPATSETSLKEGSQPSPTSDSHALFKLKYPSSPYCGHISHSPSNISPSSGHQSPAGSAPSPALSYSSTGSTRSSPADAPDIDPTQIGRNWRKSPSDPQSQDLLGQRHPTAALGTNAGAPWRETEHCQTRCPGPSEPLAPTRRDGTGYAGPGCGARAQKSTQRPSEDRSQESRAFSDIIHWQQSGFASHPTAFGERIQVPVAGTVLPFV